MVLPPGVASATRVRDSKFPTSCRLWLDQRNGWSPGDHFVEHTTETPDVRARIDFQTSGLFRRHVMCRAEHDADAGIDHVLRWRERVGLQTLSFTSEFCETEVEHFNDAVMTQHDVVGLDVAMNDADAVRGAECTGDLNTDVERFGWSEAGLF